MDEVKVNPLGELEKLALIAESCQTIFSGKATIVFELPNILHFHETKSTSVGITLVKIFFFQSVVFSVLPSYLRFSFGN